MALTWKGGARGAIPDIQTGVVMTLYPRFDIATGLSVVDAVELQRAPDSGGSPGTAEDVARIPAPAASGHVFIDPRPLTLDVWWYRHRHVRGDGAVVGAWSTWQSFTAQAINPGDNNRLSLPPGNNASSANTSSRYRCHVTASTPTSVPTALVGTLTPIVFDTEDYDVGNLHDLSTNPSRVTVPAVNYLGVWLVIGVATFAPHATGQRTAAIMKNGVASGSYETRGVVSGSIGENIQVTAAFVDPSPGDYFELDASQNSGAAMNVIGELTVIHLW